MPDTRVVTCPQCGAEFGTAKSFDTYRCPECFARFSKSDLDTGSGKMLIIVASALIVLVFVFLVAWTWPLKARNKKEAASAQDPPKTISQSQAM